MGGGLELALHCALPHAVRRRAGARVPRGLPRPGPRLGRQPAAAEPDRRRQGRHGHRRERAEPEPDAQGQAGLRARHRRRDVRAGRLPRAVAGAGRPRWSRGETTVERPEVDRGEAWDAALARGQGHRRQQGPRRGAGAVPGARADRAGPHRVLRRRLRRRGRGAGRPGHGRGAARRALRVRPGAAPRQAARRRAGQGAGPRGHQGRRRRRRADGLPARAAVRPAARGAGRADRPRPGARRQGRRLRARRDRQAARQGPDQPGQGQPAQGAGHRLDRQGGVRRRRLRHRGRLRGDEGQAAGLRRGRGGRLRRVRAGDQHVLAVGHRDGRRSSQHPERVVGLPLLQPGRGAAAARDRPRRARPTTRRWPPRSRSARR